MTTPPVTYLDARRGREGDEMPEEGAMCDSTEHYTMSMPLCANGLTASGWECTGHAHINGEHIRCSDASHVSEPTTTWIAVPPEGLSLNELLNAPPVTYPLTGAERWTCSSTPTPAAHPRREAEVNGETP